MSRLGCTCGTPHCSGECAGLRSLISGRLSETIDLEGAPPPPGYQPQFLPRPGLSAEQIPTELTELVNRWHEAHHHDERVPAKGPVELSPPLIAAGVLLFLSSKPGFIRRSGANWRCGDLEINTLDAMISAVENSQPIVFFALSFSPKFKKPATTGGQVLPDMANYVALANLHSICNAASQIYQPGIRLVIGYEGNLYAKLGRFTEQECSATLDYLQWLNGVAFRNCNGCYADSPVEIVDAVTIIADGHLDLTGAPFRVRLRRAMKQELETFRKELSKAAKKVSERDLRRIGLAIAGSTILDEDPTLEMAAKAVVAMAATCASGQAGAARNFLNWLSFFTETLDPEIQPPSSICRDLRKAACTYFAFNRIKYTGGAGGKGLLNWKEGAIPFTVQGDPNKVSLQLVPSETRFPHHRLTAWGRDDTDYLFAGYRWRLLPLSALTCGKRIYIPRYVNGASHPFFYEELKPSEDMGVMYRVVMGATVSIYARDNGCRYIVKQALSETSAKNLRRQVERARELRDLGVSAIAKPVDAVSVEGGYCIAYPYAAGNTADWELLGRTLDTPVFLERFNDILTFLYRELWSKSEVEVDMEVFSRSYRRTLKRGMALADSSTHRLIEPFEKSGGGSINGRLIPSLSLILSVVERLAAELDGEFMEAPCVATTHGDIHLGNVVCREEGGYALIDVNGNPDRRNSSVEFELSRVLLSFWREIIRCKEFVIDSEGERVWVRLTARGERILELRQAALDAILSHQHLAWYITTKHDSLMRILLMEAIDIGAVFGLREPDEQAAAYFMGALLLRQALDGWQAADIADWEEIRRLFTSSSYRDRHTHVEAEGKFRARLSDRYQSYTVLHAFGQFCLVFTDRNDASYACLEISSDIEPFFPQNAMERHVVGDTTLARLPLVEFLMVWQRFNSPGLGIDRLYTGFVSGDRKLWTAYLTGQIITICGNDFVVDEFAGLGKESKVFRVTDKTGRSYAAKIGMQWLAEEFSYGRRFKSRVGRHSWRFSEYITFDQNENIILLEHVPGEMAVDVMQHLDTPEEWLWFLSEIADVIDCLASLADEGICAGQFDLHNIIIDPDKRFRIIDPYHAGEASLYDIKQTLRIVVSLVVEIYRLDPGLFSLYVRGSTQHAQLTQMQFPAAELSDERLAAPRGLPEVINGELGRIARKYLVGRKATRCLKELAHDFKGIKKLCAWHKEGWPFGPEATPVKALALDLNGTIEDGGYMNLRTRDCLNRLAGERYMPVAVITGKRYEKVRDYLVANGLDPDHFDIFSDSGAALWRRGERHSSATIETPERIAGVLERFISGRSLDGTIFFNDSRLCISLDMRLAPDHLEDLRELCAEHGLVPVASQRVPQIDIVPIGHTKGPALERFLLLHGLSEAEVLKIGDDPFGNDADFLFSQGAKRVNAFAVASVVDTAALVEQVMDCSGYGALHRSGAIAFREGTLVDFTDAEADEIAVIEREARNTSNAFYPWDALRERFSVKDRKTVQYKWLIRNKTGFPIGIWSLAEVADEAGIYQICGTYLIPDAQGKGVAAEVIAAVDAFCQRSVANYRRLRMRIPETNLASRSLAEKCGFIPVHIEKRGYELMVNGGKELHAAIVYEMGRDVSSSKPLQLKGNPDLLPEAVAREAYERLKNTPPDSRPDTPN